MIWMAKIGKNLYSCVAMTSKSFYMHFQLQCKPLRHYYELALIKKLLLDTCIFCIMIVCVRTCSYYMHVFKCTDTDSVYPMYCICIVSFSSSSFSSSSSSSSFFTQTSLVVSTVDKRKQALMFKSVIYELRSNLLLVEFRRTKVCLNRKVTHWLN